MPILTVLTAKDKQVLQGMADKIRRDIGNTTGRPISEGEDLWTPEVYVARTPSGGIPALTEIAGASIEDRPGYADCYIYLVINDATTGVPELQPISGLFRRVYNLSHDPVGGNRWVLVIRDKFGNWFVTAPFPTPSIIDTGTGTGLGGACANVEITTYRYDCVDGNLNEYLSPVTFEFDENGCLTQIPGPLVFLRTIACCDDTCATGVGTGTGTGTEPALPPGALICGCSMVSSLHATITNKTGTCTCLPSAAELTNVSSGIWRSTPAFATNCRPGTTSFLELVCPNIPVSSGDCFDFRLNMGGGSGSQPCTSFASNPDSCSCSPLSLVFTLGSFTCCAGTARVTITE